MPVRLTEHIDRGEKSLLKGRLGAVKGWQSRSKTDTSQLRPVRVCNKSPEVIWVEFSGPSSSWQLDGVPEAAVYPIVPRQASWYLDQGRKRPVLRVSRAQMPLAPAFALTARSAQGMMLDGVILDFVLPPGGNIITVYIASKLLIIRAFPLQGFQKGLREARDLLWTAGAETPQIGAWPGAQPSESGRRLGGGGVAGGVEVAHSQNRTCRRAGNTFASFVLGGRRGGREGGRVGRQRMEVTGQNGIQDRTEYRTKNFFAGFWTQPGRAREEAGGGRRVAGSREWLEGGSDTKKVIVGQFQAQTMKLRLRELGIWQHFGLKPAVW